jgi:hypothetical protein
MIKLSWISLQRVVCIRSLGRSMEAARVRAHRRSRLLTVRTSCFETRNVLNLKWMISQSYLKKFSPVPIRRFWSQLRTKSECYMYSTETKTLAEGTSDEML